MILPITILKIVLPSIVVFFAVNYVIATYNERDILNKIFHLKKDEDDDDDDFLDDLIKLKDEFYRAKFKMYMTRSIIFGSIMAGIIYAVSKNEDNTARNMEPIIQGKNLFEKEMPQHIPEMRKIPDQTPEPDRQKVRHMFFNLPNF